LQIYILILTLILVLIIPQDIDRIIEDLQAVQKTKNDEIGKVLISLNITLPITLTITLPINLPQMKSEC